MPIVVAPTEPLALVERREFKVLVTARAVVVAPFANKLVVDAFVAKREVVVASVKSARVERIKVEKKFVEVAFVEVELTEKKLVMLPREAKKLVVVAEVPVALVKRSPGMVTWPVEVSAVRIDVEAAVRIWNAVAELTGVWKREVP